MSKLIVEMEMPKHGCCDCMVELMGLCVIQDKDVPLKNENGDYPTELPKGCPIKGVLPDEHGDLIDRDKFVDKYIRHYTEQERKMNLVFAAVEVKQDFSDMIYEEDAVIEAERKADGNDSD